MFRRTRRRRQQVAAPPKPAQPDPDFTQELIDRIDAELELEAWKQLTPDEQIEVAVYARAIDRGPVLNGGEVHEIASVDGSLLRTFAMPTAEELMERDRDAYRAGRPPGADPVVPFADMARAMHLKADRARSQYERLVAGHESRLSRIENLASHVEREVWPQRVIVGPTALHGRGLGMAREGEWFA